MTAFVSDNNKNPEWPLPLGRCQSSPYEESCKGNLRRNKQDLKAATERVRKT